MTRDPADEDLELRHYVDVLRRRKTSVAVVVLVVMAAAALLTLLQTPVYRSTAEVLVQAPLSERIFAPTAEIGRSEPAADSDVATQVAVLGSESVREAAEEKLGVKPDVSIRRKGDTDVVEITAASSDPDEATRVAQTYTDTYLAMRREQLTAELKTTMDAVKAEIGALDGLLAGIDQQTQSLNTQIQASFLREVRAPLEAQRDQLAQQRLGPESRRSDLQQRLDRLQLASTLTKTGGVELLSSASDPVRPSRPVLLRNLAVALALGLLLGAVVAFVRDHFDDTIRTEGDVEQTSPSIPLIGLVPAVADWRDREDTELVARSAPRSPSGEAYGRIRTSLDLYGVTAPGKTLQVASAGPGDGKTTTVANLGVSFAKAGRRVVLIDCNLRRPRLHHFFGLDNEVGLTSVLLGQTPISAAVQTVPDVARLRILPSGRPPPNPSEVLAAEALQQLLSSVAAQADVVLIDSPPLPVTDSILLAGRVDGVMVVACARRTARSDLAQALEVLEQTGAPLVGTLLNSAEGKAGHGLTYGREPAPRRRGLRRRGRGRRSDVDAREPAASPTTTAPPPRDAPMPVDS